MVFKNVVFYGVLCPLRFRTFILALSKNHAFYVVLAFTGGPGTQNTLVNYKGSGDPEVTPR